MADIFLSYAREDKPRAAQVAAGLEAAGFDVFWDNEIPPGQTWADYIESKLSSCRAVVVLWSANSTRSQYVREEARDGRNRGLLFPALIDSSPVPFGFGEVQSADLSTWTGQPRHEGWDRLLSALHGALSGDVAPRPLAQSIPGPTAAPAAVTVNKTITVQSGAPSMSAAGPRRGIHPAVWVGGAAALVIAAGAIFAMGQNSGARQVAQSSPAIVGPQSAQAATNPAAMPQMTPEVQRAYTVLNAQFQQYGQIFAQEGYQPYAQPYANALAPGAPTSVPVTLQAGVNYQVLAVCDANCRDIDLRLLDQNGVQVGIDMEPDDHPVINVQPIETAQFQLQVLMSHCAAQQCFYAAQLYARPGG